MTAGRCLLLPRPARPRGQLINAKVDDKLSREIVKTCSSALPSFFQEIINVINDSIMRNFLSES